MTKFIATVIGMGALATAAFAADVTEIDTNGDGVMSADEVMAVFPDVTPEQFDQADANGDGALDDAEMSQAQQNGVMPMSSDG